MTQRFLMIDISYIPKDEYWLIINDYKWWGKNFRIIKEWTTDALTELDHEGMILKFVSDEERNVFLMRWANG